MKIQFILIALLLSCFAHGDEKATVNVNQVVICENANNLNQILNRSPSEVSTTVNQITYRVTAPFKTSTPAISIAGNSIIVCVTVTK